MVFLYQRIKTSLPALRIEDVHAHIEFFIRYFPLMPRASMRTPAHHRKGPSAWIAVTCRAKTFLVASSDGSSKSPYRDRRENRSECRAFGQDLPELDMIALATRLLLRLADIAVEDLRPVRITRARPLHPRMVHELAAIIGEDGREQSFER